MTRRYRYTVDGRTAEAIITIGPDWWIRRYGQPTKDDFEDEAVRVLESVVGEKVPKSDLVEMG
jgi:hypothetical protein